MYSTLNLTLFYIIISCQWSRACGDTATGVVILCAVCKALSIKLNINLLTQVSKMLNHLSMISIGKLYMPT